MPEPLSAGAQRVQDALAGCQKTRRALKNAQILGGEGFAIGGVAPVGHTRALATLIDEDLMTWQQVWAAGGHPNTVFSLAPRELARITGGRVVRVK